VDWFIQGDRLETGATYRRSERERGWSRGKNGKTSAGDRNGLIENTTVDDQTYCSLPKTSVRWCKGDCDGTGGLGSKSQRAVVLLAEIRLGASIGQARNDAGEGERDTTIVQDLKDMCCRGSQNHVAQVR